MENINKVYKCLVCGSVVERANDINSTLVCCDKNMMEQSPKTEETKLEKHVPFIEEIEGGVLVKIGENEDHPMLDNHYIEFIEILTKGGAIIRKNLNPGDKPETTFSFRKDQIVQVREFCNLHGLWIHDL